MSAAPRARTLAPLLAALAMLGPFSIDTFFPAFRVIGGEFGVSAAAMQQTVSVYLAAFAAMALVHGPLSDAYGRRPVILVALSVFTVASIGCALAPSFPMLLLFRGLQGLSAGAGMIVGRAMIRDRFEGADAQRLLSQVSLIFSIAPALAPIAGGWMLDLGGGWRRIFEVLTGYAALLLLFCLWRLPETNAPELRRPVSVSNLRGTYLTVLRDRPAIALMSAAALNFGALFLYVASAPSLVLDQLGLNERQFGWLFIPLIGGLTIGSLCSGRLAGRLDPVRTVGLGYALIFVGVACNIGIGFGLPRPMVPWTVLPASLGAVGISMAFPTLTLLILDRFSRTRGAAASVQAAFNLGLNAIIAGVLAPLFGHHTQTLALGAALLSGGGFLMWSLYRRLDGGRAPAGLGAVGEC